jgi:beta-ribofuranosylaminobenzene 5'-phosphate synthase
MVRVQTASRLHFGLLSLAPEGSLWTDRLGTLALSARRFGGAGLMVEQPGIRLSVEAAVAWSAEGPLAERALTFARRFAESVAAVGLVVPTCCVVVEEAPPEHAGLGTGTQLGLAVGRCLASVAGLVLSASEIARHVGRGERSALGVHGFERGGFMVEAGQAAPGTLGPLVAHCPFPPDWRVVLARPEGVAGTHGPEERSTMARLVAPVAVAELQCRLVLLGMLPALAERNIDGFGDALFDFNARAGEVFAPVQGGIYASPAVAELVAFIRGRSVRGVGQSSWGPTVFAVVASEEQAQELARALRVKSGDANRVHVTRAASRGAVLTSETSPLPSG